MLQTLPGSGDVVTLVRSAIGKLAKSSLMEEEEKKILFTYNQKDIQIFFINFRKGFYKARKTVF